jgi:hypothetical protein
MTTTNASPFNAPIHEELTNLTHDPNMKAVYPVRMTLQFSKCWQNRYPAKKAPVLVAKLEKVMPGNFPIAAVAQSIIYATPEPIRYELLVDHYLP